MKNLQFAILLLFMASGSFAQQYGWVALTSPKTGNLKRIFISGKEAWLLSDNKIFYSSNYPLVQFAETFTGLTTFSDMTFANQGVTNYGWIVGYASMGARTTDLSALVWTDMYLSGDLTFSCVSFPNTSVGFGSGTDKRLHKTLNGGVDWFDTGVQLSNGDINTIVFTDTLNGYIGGSAPSFKKTIDGGLNWSSISGYTGTINDIYFYNSSHGWAVGAFDIFCYNVSSWIRISNAAGKSLNSVFFINANEGWIVGNGGTILHSTDGGATWTAQTSGTTVTLRDVFFTSPTNGYAVGNNGTILHYTQITGVEEHPTQPTAFNLEQNFPNPFDSETKISYSLAIPAQVQLTVCNMFGQQVALLDKGFKPAGSFSADFTGEGLPSGIYYYRLQCGDRHETRKMTLIK
jgi:photosystem II stability/assembly factor-like uncharacterized protein